MLGGHFVQGVKVARGPDVVEDASYEVQESACPAARELAKSPATASLALVLLKNLILLMIE